MNIHKNARTTPQSRALLVHRVLREHWPVSAVAIAFGISERTVYKWLARYRAEGAAGLLDRSSTAHRRPHALSPAWLALIRLLRHAKLVAAEIAARLPLARSTVSSVLRRLGLGRLRYLNPPPPVQRYEWSRPGELVHVDTKKLGRIVQPSHRVTGNRRDSVAAAAGNTLMSPSTTARASPTSRSCPTSSAIPRRVSGCARCAPSAPRHSHPARADRQRRRLPLAPLPQGLPLAAHQHQAHPTVSPADQRQGRAHDPNPVAQMGLRRAHLNFAHRRAALDTWLRFYNEERPHASLNRQTPLSRLVQFAEQRS